jgi:cell division protein ZipA
MEGYLRLILLAAGAIIIVFIIIESLLTRRRQFKISNLSENFSATPQHTESADEDYFAQEVNEADLDPSDAEMQANEVEDYYLTEGSHHPTTEKNWHMETFPEDGEEVVVDVRVESRVEAMVGAEVETRVIEQPVVKAAPVKEDAPDYANDLLVLSVVAKPGLKFGSYDLLQAIYATGLEFGDMNIFHYYSGDGLTKEKLFSLASATEPGDFDLDRIGNYTCSGLTLFTVLSTVPDPQKAFDAMLKAAEQLTEDLNGQLRAGPRRPWNQETYHEYQQKVLYFLLKQRA